MTQPSDREKIVHSILSSRTLAPYELFYFWRNALKYYTNFRVAARYTPVLTPDLIFRVLTKMIRQHANLSSNAFAFRSKAPSCPSIASSTLDQARQYLNDNILTDVSFEPDSDQWEPRIAFLHRYSLADVLTIIDDPSVTATDVLNQVQSTSFAYNTHFHPVWGLVLLNQHELIFYADHLLYDGTSGLNFHRLFSQYLKQELHQNNDDIQIAPTADVAVESRHPVMIDDLESAILFDISNPEHIEQIVITPLPTAFINFQPSLTFAAYTLITELGPSFLASWTKHWFSKDQYLAQYSNTIAHHPLICHPGMLSEKSTSLYISSRRMAKLLLLCRRHDVKLTSLFLAVAHLVLVPIVGDVDSETNIPVNARPKINTTRAQELIKDAFDQRNGQNESTTVDNVFRSEIGIYVGNLTLSLPPISRIAKIHPNIDSLLEQLPPTYHNSVKNDTTVTSNSITAPFLDWDFVKYIHHWLHNNLPISQSMLGMLGYVNPKHYVIGSTKHYRVPYAPNPSASSSNNTVVAQDVNGVAMEDLGHRALLEISNLGDIGRMSDLVTDTWFDQPNNSALFSINAVSSAAGATLTLRAPTVDWLARFNLGLDTYLTLLAATQVE